MLSFRKSQGESEIRPNELIPSRAPTTYNRVPSEHEQDWDSPHSFVASNNTALWTRDRAQGKHDGIATEAFSSIAASLYKRLGWKNARFQKTRDLDRKTSPQLMRKAIVAAALVTGLVLLINLIFLLVGIVQFKPTDGIGVIYTGGCDVVKHWNTALHLLINILGTALLAASSFTMQCLSSPTRSDVDRAHAKRISLEIGVASVKNLFRLNWKRGLLWCALALSSVPLHLLWNSVVFSTLNANEYLVIIVTEQFLQGDPYTNAWDDCLYGLAGTKQSTVLSSIYTSYKNGSYSGRLEPSACISAYASPYVTGRRNVLAVTKPVAGTTHIMPCTFGDIPDDIPSVGSENMHGALWNGSSVLAYDSRIDSQWLCWGYDSWLEAQGSLYQTYHCDAATAQSLLTENGTWYLRPAASPEAYAVDYCLSEDKVPEHCDLQYSSYLLEIVIACNLIKLIALVATILLLQNLQTPVLATVGDAVASYLQRPDLHTTGWCLMGRKQANAWRKKCPNQRAVALYSCSRRQTLFSTVSKTRWVVTMSFCTLYLASGIVFCYLAVQSAVSAYTTAQVWKMGLGQFQLGLTEDFAWIGFQLRHFSRFSMVVSNILVANSFQLALSTTYFLYNSLYTAQCGAIEWMSYSKTRKPLRVSWPRGQQRSTYWLHLPYRYGVPLTVSLMLLHFLISQAIFLAQVQYYNVDGTPDYSETQVGYSPVGILASCCVGAVLVLSQVLHSLRTIEAPIPLHGNDSIAISAACHPLLGSSGIDESALLDEGKEDISLGNVMWGAEVQPKYEGDVGHCSFTAGVVEMPVNGNLYQ